MVLGEDMTAKQKTVIGLVILVLVFLLGFVPSIWRNDSSLFARTQAATKAQP
jgi:hypothetical protein